MWFVQTIGVELHGSGNGTFHRMFVPFPSLPLPVALQCIGRFCSAEIPVPSAPRQAGQLSAESVATQVSNNVKNAVGCTDARMACLQLDFRWWSILNLFNVTRYLDQISVRVSAAFRQECGHYDSGGCLGSSITLRNMHLTVPSTPFVELFHQIATTNGNQKNRAATSIVV
jgi:hypothetical protein